MIFSTPISIQKNEKQIDYNSKIVLLGSCFAENMAEKFDYFKFQHSCNPFGILFHPLAIEKLIDYAVSEKQFNEDDVFFHNEQWHCFDAHSELSNSNQLAIIDNLNSIVKSLKLKLQEASHIIITYGTSWVYRNIATNNIVANCHKVPQGAFKKEILSIGTIEKSIQNTINLIQKINPKCNFIFTVSPVRHLKDGFVENQQSKAHLFSAIHQILQSEICNLKSAIYFPSYEIMMDELRDYRFYGSDMIHPNSVAIDYIWQRFSENYISDQSHHIMKEIEIIQKGLAHRPFNISSENHQKFLVNLNEKIGTLLSKFPHIQF
jgi:hypothetical protein